MALSLLTKNNKRVSNFFDSGKLFPNKVDWSKDLVRSNRETPVVADVNIIENENDFTVEVAAPGLEKKDFIVEIEKGVLSISVEKEEKKSEIKNYKRREFSYNSFSRAFTLPENANFEKIEAKYENGILNLSLPKKVVPSKETREIKVL